MRARIALFGQPGVGKSTVRRISETEAPSLGIEIHHFRLADPLYLAQSEIYRIAGRPLAEMASQDGRLLNILGVEMRRINPQVLADHARARLVQIGREAGPDCDPHIVICDDMRPNDAGFMRDLGFEFVLVRASEGLATQRRRLRGDLTLGATDDPNEVGVDDVEFKVAIDNNGSMNELIGQVRELLATEAG